jgi:Ni,Fe-hydrogenase III small subunit
MPLILLALPLVIALLSLMVTNRKIMGAISVLGSATIVLISLLIALQVFAGLSVVWGQFIFIDTLSALILSLVAIIGFMVALYSLGYLSHDIREGEFSKSRIKWYFFWLYIFIFTMFLVLISANLGIMWVAVEGTTLATALLVGPVYDIQRLGFDFVASPRHADVLMVTGPVTRNLEIAVHKTFAATPSPKLVLAVGTCACSGGICGKSYASSGGVENIIPVDVFIPGCPPRPQALIQGLLKAIGKA